MWQAISISWKLHELGPSFVYVSVSQSSRGNNPATEFTSVVLVKILVNEFSINIGAGWCLGLTVIFFFLMVLPLLKFCMTTSGILSIWKNSWFGKREANAQVITLNSLHFKIKMNVVYSYGCLSVFVFFYNIKGL